MRTLICAALLMSGMVHAQSWPTGPITVYISNSAGSSPDIILRQLTERLQRSMKQTFVIINRPGGNGIPPALPVMRAKPDGYTLLFAGNSQLTANVYLVKNLPYDPDRDFVPIAMVVDSAPLVVAAHPSLKANSLAELIALAKAQPGKLAYAASGSLAPIFGELLNRSAGMDILQVNYKDTAQGVNETVGGVPQLVYQALPNVDALHRAGKLKFLAVSSLKRFPVIPDVPAVSETLPGFSLDGWFVLLGPAGLPQDRIRLLNREVDLALKDPELGRRMASFGFASSGAKSTEEIREFMRGGRDQWAKIVRELGLQPQ
jgi:tripartite-type tricarboxylate transporter receptor subunit TctC